VLATVCPPREADEGFESRAAARRTSSSCNALCMLQLACVEELFRPTLLSLSLCSRLVNARGRDNISHLPTAAASSSSSSRASDDPPPGSLFPLSLPLSTATSLAPFSPFSLSLSLSLALLAYQTEFLNGLFERHPTLKRSNARETWRRRLWRRRRLCGTNERDSNQIAAARGLSAGRGDGDGRSSFSNGQATVGDEGGGGYGGGDPSEGIKLRPIYSLCSLTPWGYVRCRRRTRTISAALSGSPT